MKIGVIGVGNIGRTVCADLLFRGIETVGIDTDPSALASARDDIHRALRFGPALSKALPRVDADEAMGQLQLTSEFGALESCEFVIENVPEVWEIKREVYAVLAPALPPAAVVACNTSCISITRLASLVPDPQRVLGMHFMNPAYVAAAVEVVRGMQTSAETLLRAEQLVTTLGKESVVVDDFPGFASNRVSHLFMNEAAWVVQDGVASAADVDRLFRKGFGHRMGPLQTADLIGLDTVAATLDMLREQFGDPKFRCCPLLRKMVDAGRLGRKSGRGFYDYGSN